MIENHNVYMSIYVEVVPGSKQAYMTISIFNNNDDAILLHRNTWLAHVGQPGHAYVITGPGGSSIPCYVPMHNPPGVNNSMMWKVLPNTSVSYVTDLTASCPLLTTAMWNVPYKIKIVMMKNIFFTPAIEDDQHFVNFHEGAEFVFTDVEHLLSGVGISS